MKTKFLISILSVGLILTSCVNSQKDKYFLSVLGDDATHVLPKESYYEIDSKIEFKVANTYDVTFYAYLNDTKLSSVSQDKSYTYYEFLMPNKDSKLVITGNKYYLDKPYSFSEIFYWVSNINVNNIKEIQIEQGISGVNPDSEEIVTTSSIDIRDIEYNINILNTEKLYKTDNRIRPGSAYQKVSFILDNLTYTLEIYDGCVLWRDFANYQYFRFENETSNRPTIKYPKEG